MLGMKQQQFTSSK